MSLRLRLTLAFAVLIGLFAVNVVFYFVNDQRRSTSFAQLDGALKSRLLVQEIDSSLEERRRRIRLLQVLEGSGDQLVGDDELAEILESLERLRRRARMLEGQAAEPEMGHSELVQVMEPLLDQWSDYFRRLNSADADRDSPGGEGTVAIGQPASPDGQDGQDGQDGRDGQGTQGGPADGEGDLTADELYPRARSLLDRLDKIENEGVQKASQEYWEVRRLTNDATIAIFTVTLVLALLVAILLGTYLTRKLKQLEAGARRFGEGDLDHRIRLKAGDELGLLAEAFNDMAGKLRLASVKEAEARQAAEDANQAKSTFLANMSHELRTPMNAILGYSEMLVEEAEDDGLDDYIADLRKIIAAGKHLLALINDVLDLSKIEAGKMTLFVEEIPIADLLSDVVATVEPMVRKNGNELRIDAGLGSKELADHEARQALGTVSADETKVRQALFNLLSNAAKFTENGEVIIRFRRLGDQVRFQVQDTGIGMTPAQLERVFDEFTQADASTTRKFGGTGLGLSISRKFCRLMGGDLYAESEEGVGSTFTIDLPQEVDPSTEDETILSRLSDSGRVRPPQ